MSIYDGQQYEHNVVHVFRKRLTFSDAAGVYSLGWVPHYATVLRGGVAVLTAFDYGTNNRLNIGYRNGGDGETDDTDEFGTLLALTTAGVIDTDEMATAAVNTFPKGAEIVVDLDVTGTAGTAGEAIVWVEYIVDNDGDTTS